MNSEAKALKKKIDSNVSELEKKVRNTDALHNKIDEKLSDNKEYEQLENIKENSMPNTTAEILNEIEAFHQNIINEAKNVSGGNLVDKESTASATST